MPSEIGSQTGSLSDILQYGRAALGRYASVALAPAITVLLLGLFFSYRVADYYIADSLISIQQQKISSKIVDAPTKMEQSERLQAMIFEILSRPRLRSIIEQFQLYPDLVGVIGKDIALERFRAAIAVEPVMSKTGDRLFQTFRLEFSHPEAKVAYDVTKSVANLFIEESMLSTRSETEGTEEFLDTQLRAARQRLEATEQLVQAFVRENFGKLPDHLNASIARLENAQSQLATNSQLISANVSRMAYLQQDLKLTSQESVVLPDDKGGAVDPREGLLQLESALIVLRSKYSDSHPDVIGTKRRISALKARIESEQSDPSARTESVPQRRTAEVRSVRREIAEIESQLAALKAENVHLKATIEELEGNIKEMPLKEQELIKIRRDYDNVKANYERLSAAREEAGLQASLVSSQKGTQFRIIEPPAMPVVPAGPPRFALTLASFAAAFATFLLIPFALFFLNTGFKFRNEVESEIGLKVLGVIPPMQTARAETLWRRALSASVITSACSFAAGCLVIVFLL